MRFIVSYILGLSVGVLFMQGHVVPRVIAGMLFASWVYFGYSRVEGN